MHHAKVHELMNKFINNINYQLKILDMSGKLNLVNFNNKNSKLLDLTAAEPLISFYYLIVLKRLYNKINALLLI